ncbi:MAG TPA: GNAT family N-acetyltransferase [Acidobacteriaceae bacterium]|jgi:ribosomal protein S18 acetylase RimI-like enzyme|nr:GNAT family N-acetyltransferase [Acidobacteriaceae bacterium]
MTLALLPATEADLPAIVRLMNAAYRGKESEEGWSTEGGIITGDRATVSLLQEEIADGAIYLLVKEEGVLRGCVSLQAASAEKWYLGALTVSPAQQKGGFGRALLAAAEQYAAERGARTIEMTVVHLRDALIAWYERRGYRLTGETRPFPYGDPRFGTPTRDDLTFVVLEKHLRAADTV